MSSIFSLEPVARNATLSHFFLMFGYKLFSFFFPLFLLEKGFSLPQVGYAYLFLYLPVALFAPIVGALNHRWNPGVLASLGIAGYGLYALLMLAAQSVPALLAAQALLGAAAALFFTSVRSVLMGSALQNPDRAFGWFYSMSFYVEALAPVLGAVIIWQTGFFGVFLLSFAIHAANAMFTMSSLRQASAALTDKDGTGKIIVQYRNVVDILRQNALLPFLAVSFSMLLVAGFYRAFFVLFLQDLGWAQSTILLYGATFSLLFVPVSLLIIHRASRKASADNVLQGGVVYALSSMIFGMAAWSLNFLGILSVMLARSAGSLLGNTGRSALVQKHSFQYPEEAGAVDTVFSPLGVALGSLLGGLLVTSFGYSTLFFWAGVFVLFVTFLGFIAKSRVSS